MRTCKVCGKSKPLKQFPISDHQLGYRRRDCHDCYKARHRRYYEERGYEYRARVTRSYAVRRDEVLKAYGGRCTCCGESEPKFLTIEHTNGDGAKLRTVHGKGRQFFRWLKDRGFPKEFAILCFNCNVGSHLNGGTCPHKEGSTTRRKP